MSGPKTKAVAKGGKTVFEDLGIAMTPADLLKADLAAVISRAIQARGLSQEAAAALLGIDQPKVSKLLRGRLKDFSVERLVGLVLALGHDIDIAIRKGSKATGRVQVAA